MSCLLPLKELRAEIEKLKGVTGLASDDVIGASIAEIASLKHQLSQKEQEMDEMTRCVLGSVTHKRQ